MMREKGPAKVWGAFDLEEAQRLEERFGRIERACMAGELLPREETSRAADVCWSA